MIIELIQSNGGTTVEPIEISNEIIPRVGETLSLAQEIDGLQGITELLVLEVSYYLENKKLTPFIKCLACNPNTEERLLRLREHGWIYPPLED